MPPLETRPDAVRWNELDGVRGFAALLVVYVHLFLQWVPAQPPPVFWLRTLSGLAWTGVDLFFILSGFLIGGILLRNREAENYYRVFYLRRAFRILPLYFALLLLFFALRFGFSIGHAPGLGDGAIPWGAYPLLVQNFPMAWTGDWGSAPLGVTWSVALEEQFYLCLPLLIRWIPARRQFAAFALLALAAPALRAIPHPLASTFLLSGSTDLFFSGVILAWLFLHRPVVFQAPSGRTLAAVLFGAGGLGMAWLAVRGHLGPFRETVIALFWGSFLWLVLAFRGTCFTAPLRWRPLCWVGGISYGVYLLHVLVSHLLFLAVFGKESTESMGRSGFLLSCLCLGLTLGIAYLSARFFERPLTAFGHRFNYRKPEVRSPEAVRD
jgi:peptidoglycan/LPS O-acetylase OafA/YrhL